jgi:type IV secretory pathway VirD2 relaxase
MDLLDDLPVFRPRIRGGRGPASRGPGPRFRNTVLAFLRGAAVRGSRSRAAARGQSDGLRRVVIKAHVVRLRGGGLRAAALHLRYIQREGVEKDGSRGEFYGPDGPANADAFAQPRPGEKHQFRIVVAPEEGADLELSAYVQRLMKQVERDLGRELEWGAVNHFNTGHPHAHVVIRGVDRQGREVRLDREYISNGLRGRAQELATEELGPRLEVDIRRARTKEITQERFTSLDRELARRAQNDRVEVGWLGRGRVDHATLVGRLQHLEDLRLAEKVGPGAWLLVPGWQEELRELGARGDILKEIHRAVQGDRSRYHVVRPRETLAPDTQAADAPVLRGRVAGKGLSDELKGTYYAVLETPSGDAYHVPLDRRSAEQLRTGDLVSFATVKQLAVRPVDREVAEAARRSNGTYVLGSRTEQRVHPHVRRLHDLERMGLAVREAGDRWKVAPDLLRRLEERERSAPSPHRVRVRKEPLSLEDQVRHRGETWLDRVDAGLLAPHGFGAEVARAQARRHEVLRQVGIHPDDPNRSAKLAEIERRAVGEQMASRSGLVFVAETPASFRGRADLVKSPAADTLYVSVSGGSRCVLLRATPALQAIQGKVIEVTRDRRGELQVRLAPDRDLGR